MTYEDPQDVTELDGTAFLALALLLDKDRDRVMVQTLVETAERKLTYKLSEPGLEFVIKYKR